MIKPAISIIVPVYNSAKYLPEFFSKLEEQTFQNFKVYIVYDESKDDSLDKINAQINAKPDKYELLVSPKKEGVGAARDYALNSGKIDGDYILFLDPDDYPENIFLERLYQKAVETGADVIACGFERFEDKSNKVLCTEMVHNPEYVVTDIIDFDLFAYMNPVVWDKLYRRDAIEGLRFTKVKRAEDVFWLMRMIPRIKSIAFINEVLYHYRVRNDSLLNTIGKKEYFEAIDGFVKVGKEIQEKKIQDEYVELLNAIAFFRCGIGITYRSAINDIKNTKQYIKKSKQVLDECYPGWDKNKFLKLRICQKHGIKGIAIWVCNILYKINFFQIYIYLYYFFQKRFKIEIKW